MHHIRTNRRRFCSTQMLLTTSSNTFSIRGLFLLGSKHFLSCKPDQIIPGYLCQCTTLMFPKWESRAVAVIFIRSFSLPRAIFMIMFNFCRVMRLFLSLTLLCFIFFRVNIVSESYWTKLKLVVTCWLNG